MSRALNVMNVNFSHSILHACVCGRSGILGILCMRVFWLFTHSYTGAAFAAGMERHAMEWISSIDRAVCR